MMSENLAWWVFNRFRLLSHGYECLLCGQQLAALPDENEFKIAHGHWKLHPWWERLIFWFKS